MTQHATSHTPSTALEPTFAERVRTLLETERIGTSARSGRGPAGRRVGAWISHDFTTELTENISVSSVFSVVRLLPAFYGMIL